MLIHFISNNIQIVFDGQISDDLQFFQCKDFATWVLRVAENQGFHPILLHGIFQYIGIKVKFRRI